MSVTAKVTEIKDNSQEEIILDLPRPQKNEDWETFSARVQRWDAETIEKRHASGAFRLVGYQQGLSVRQRGLFLTLYWHSYSHGKAGCDPIRVCSRTIAAILRCSLGVAQKELKGLVDAGALEMLAKPVGRRCGVYRVAIHSQAHFQKKTPPAISQPAPPLTSSKPDTNEQRQPSAVPDTPAPPAQAKIEESSPLPIEHEELIRKVDERFEGKVSARTVVRLCQESSVEAVAQQLEWMQHRDLKKWTNGPAAAFVTFCKKGEPEPEGLIRDRYERQQMKIQQEKFEATEETIVKEKSAFEIACAILGESELELCKETVRNKTKCLKIPEAGAIFMGMLKAEVLNRSQGIKIC